jgi:hypothetical protein
LADKEPIIHQELRASHSQNYAIWKSQSPDRCARPVVSNRLRLPDRAKASLADASRSGTISTKRAGLFPFHNTGSDNPGTRPDGFDSANFIFREFGLHDFSLR